MVVDAEQRRAELLADNDTDGILFKLRKDPRVTSVGAAPAALVDRRAAAAVQRVPRRHVAGGAASRAARRGGKYAEHVRRRLVVKPGMTGLWQVSGRSDLSWDESVRLDLRYVENWSFALDLQILWKTIAVLVRRSGAY